MSLTGNHSDVHGFLPVYWRKVIFARPFFYIAHEEPGSRFLVGLTDEFGDQRSLARHGPGLPAS